jgi:hypothetical protein
MTEITDRLVAYLETYAKGESRAVRASTLCSALGLEASEQGKRVVRAAAQHAVQSGYLVCASQRGYFLPSSPSEVDSTARRLESESAQLKDRYRRLLALKAKHFPVSQDRPGLLALMEAS